MEYLEGAECVRLLWELYLAAWKCVCVCAHARAHVCTRVCACLREGKIG